MIQIGRDSGRLLWGEAGGKREQSWTDHRGPFSAISMLVEVGLFPRDSADLNLPFEKVF